jgi:hypothetical protein
MKNPIGIDTTINTTADGLRHAETIYLVHFDAAMRGQPQPDTMHIIGAYCYLGFRLAAELKSESLFKLANKAAELFALAACMTGGKQLKLNEVGKGIFNLFNFSLIEAFRRLPPAKIGECYALALQDTLFAMSPDGLERANALEAAHNQTKMRAVGRKKK